MAGGVGDRRGGELWFDSILWRVQEYNPAELLGKTVVGGVGLAAELRKLWIYSFLFIYN